VNGTYFPVFGRYRLEVNVTSTYPSKLTDFVMDLVSVGVGGWTNVVIETPPPGVTVSETAPWQIFATDFPINTTVTVTLRFLLRAVGPLVITATGRASSNTGTSTFFGSPYKTPEIIVVSCT
jgi:hypothetical protein